MAAPPSLDDNAKKLLRTLVSRSNFMRGAEAMKMIGMDDSKVFADLVDKLRRHPLKRVLRVGKMTLAALEAVLGLYRSPDRLAERLTILRLLTRPAAAMQAQAERLVPVVQAAVGDAYEVTAEPMLSQIGSGALPVDALPSHGLTVRRVPGRRGSLDRLEATLRALPHPVLGRIATKALWLDLRCLDESEEADFVAQWSQLRP